jgi:hypothetical protein
MPKMYRTAQGRVVDFEAMQLKNEHVPAVGNMRVNARGDELGSNNTVIRNNNERVAEHYTAYAPIEQPVEQSGILEESLPEPVTTEKPKRKEKTDV